MACQQIPPPRVRIIMIINSFFVYKIFMAKSKTVCLYLEGALTRPHFVDKPTILPYMLKITYLYGGGGGGGYVIFKKYARNVGI